MPTNAPISFLDLPAEIRNQIYSHHSCQDQTTLIYRQTPGKLKTASPLSLVSKQVREEFIAVLDIESPKLNAIVKDFDFSHIFSFYYVLCGRRDNEVDTHPDYRSAAPKIFPAYCYDDLDGNSSDTSSDPGSDVSYDPTIDGPLDPTLDGPLNGCHDVSTGVFDAFPKASPPDSPPRKDLIIHFEFSPEYLARPRALIHSGWFHSPNHPLFYRNINLFIHYTAPSKFRDQWTNLEVWMDACGRVEQMEPIYGEWELIELLRIVKRFLGKSKGYGPWGSRNMKLIRMWSGPGPWDIDAS